MKIKMVLAQLILIGTVSAGVLDDLNNETCLRAVQVLAIASEVMWAYETVRCFDQIEKSLAKAAILAGHLFLFNPAVVAVCQMNINNLEKKEEQNKK